ncbi:GIY-YIG nuclease family protein, partial [Desulfamplus magnetovallimortis]
IIRKTRYGQLYWSSLVQKRNHVVCRYKLIMTQIDPKSKGTYILILQLKKKQHITVGKLGEIKFSKGYYAYVGSAFGTGGLNSRINHHRKTPKKRLHWHIDYLREEAELKQVWVSDHEENLEHEWASILSHIAIKPISKFGCSDCKCESHLFHFKTMGFMKDFKEIVAEKNYIIKPFQNLP